MTALCAGPGNRDSVQRGRLSSSKDSAGGGQLPRSDCGLSAAHYQCKLTVIEQPFPSTAAGCAGIGVRTYVAKQPVRRCARPVRPVNGKRDTIDVPADAKFLNEIALSSPLEGLTLRRRAFVKVARSVTYTASMCQPLLKSAVRKLGGTRSSFAARHNKAAGRDIAT